MPNPSVPALYEDALVYETGSAITSSGALTAYSGAKTGRSPLDKRIVKEESSEKDIWWGPVNKPMTPEVCHMRHSFFIVVASRVPNNCSLLAIHSVPCSSFNDVRARELACAGPSWRCRSTKVYFPLPRISLTSLQDELGSCQSNLATHRSVLVRRKPTLDQVLVA